MLRYIHDQFGNKSDVIISIDEWEELKKEPAKIATIESDFEIPEWQQNIVIERINNPGKYLDAFKMINQAKEKYK
jgi:hypothetical protein